MAESPSGLFPDVRTDWDLAASDVFVTEILTARSGREQRRTGASDRRAWTASSAWLSVTDRKTVRDFLVSHKGRYQAFNFWCPLPEQLTAYAVGSVASATTITPSLKGQWWLNETPVAAQYTTVYVGGVSKAFSVAANIGSNGEDRITFTGGAQTGAVTVDATLARVLIVARYDSDAIKFALAGQLANSPTHFPIAVQELI